MGKSTLLLAVLLALFLSAPVKTEAYSASAPTATLPGSPTNNSWSKLTPAQQQALKPLAGEWPTMGPQRQQKWLAIADKFQKMKPDEQQRAQQKMTDWVKLTPEQRLAARENYIRSNKLKPDQRTQKWQEYQQLSEEQKAQLASHEKKKLITNLPSPEESKAKKLEPLQLPKKLPHALQSPQPIIPNSSAASSAVPATAQPALPASAPPTR